MEFQQRVIDAWESHGPSGQGELLEAKRLLEQLKIKARGSSTSRLPIKALPLPQTSISARNAQSNHPDNEKPVAKLSTR